MKIDFHYYCVAILARAAGFNSEDALTIAYASQYVDHSTESELMPLDIKGSNLKFDPVRTAYDLLKPKQGLKALSWSAQKRIYIPFHFIPSKPFDPSKRKSFTFRTERASQFGRELLDEAAKEENHKRRLCRIGVALHTYADSWSHADFSGIEDPVENNVSGIHLWDRAKEGWTHPKIENVGLDALPEIGHAEAGFFPDLSYQKWRCTVLRTGTPRPKRFVVQRDNIKAFLQAAENIYAQLDRMQKDGPPDPIRWKGKLVNSVPWTALRPRIRRMFAAEPEGGVLKRWLPSAYRFYHAAHDENLCKRWEDEFKNDFFSKFPDRFQYCRHTWRRDAVVGDTEWDPWTRRDWAKQPRRKLKRNFWDSLWFHFHRAALSQRHFVLERLP